MDEAGRVEPLPAAPRDYVGPRVSPDGTRIAVEVTEPRAGGNATHIFVVARDSGVATQLTFGGTRNLYPVWTPDGESIIFAADRGEEKGWGIFRKAADGAGEEILIVEHAGPLVPGDVSRAGVLVFEQSATSSPSEDLWTIPLNGRDKAAPFLATAARETYPRFSPDGRFVAYESDVSTTRQVYVRPFPLTDDRQWRISEERGALPEWSPDGASLYFVVVGGDAPLLLAPIQTTPSIRRGPLRRLFSFSALFGRPNGRYDVLPEGGRIMNVQSDLAREGNVEQVVTVQNWFEELKRLVPTN